MMLIAANIRSSLKLFSSPTHAHLDLVDSDHREALGLADGSSLKGLLPFAMITSEMLWQSNGGQVGNINALLNKFVKFGEWPLGKPHVYDVLDAEDDAATYDMPLPRLHIHDAYPFRDGTEVLQVPNITEGLLEAAGVRYTPTTHLFPLLSHLTGYSLTVQTFSKDIEFTEMRGDIGSNFHHGLGETSATSFFMDVYASSD